MRRLVVGLLILVSALCLLVSSTSLWVRHNVINTQVFVSNVETIVDLPQVEARITDRVTATVMTNPEVQDAIDGAVAALPERLQRFQPTVETGIRSLVSAGVAQLLRSDPFRPLTQAALTSAHTQLVNGQPVRFTLGQAKDLVPASARDGLAGQVLGLLPNDVGVTLITPADTPQVYNIIDLLKSAWWWIGLLALALLAGALWISRHRRGTLRAWAVTTTVLSLLVLLTLRVARGQILVQAKPENRDAIGAAYDVLAGGLRSWTLWLVAILLFTVLETLIWGHVGIVPGIRRGVGAARAQVRRRREEHRAAQAAAAQAALAAGSAPEPVPEESWPRRVAANTKAFAEGLDLDRRAATFGSFVHRHLRPARWTGIVLGAVVLLLWPAPTLSVLIWIAALVGIYLGLLEWLQSRAPEVAAAEPEPAVPAVAGPAAPQVPAARTPANGLPVPALVAVGAAEPMAPVAASSPPARVPEEPPVLSPEVLAGLSGRLDLLVRLGAARDAGVLTEEEFAREKGRLLAV